MIMQTGMVVRNHSANDRGTGDRSGQTGTGLPGHLHALNGDPSSGKLTRQTPKMITGWGARPLEKWRRCTKVIMLAKDDRAK